MDPPQNQVNVNIEESDPLDQHYQRNNVFTRQESAPPRAVLPNRNNLGLGDRLNSVFREIRPFVEQARMGNNARLSLPSWLPRNQPGTHQMGEPSIQRPQSTIAHINLGPHLVESVVRAPATRQTSHISTSTSIDSMSEVHERTIDIPETANQSNNNNLNDNEEDRQSDETNPQQVVDIGATINMLVKYAPFYFIIFMKFLYDSREGIFTFLVLFSTFVHSNSLVRREHGKQMNRNLFAIFCELIFTIGCVSIVQFLFGDNKLLENIVMFPNYSQPMQFAELMWLVLLTDLILKIFTVDIKLLVTMMPAFVLPYQKRGKIYLFVEAVSQLYRALITIQPWMFYIMQTYEGSEKMVGMFLGSIYIVSKFLEILLRVRLFKNATWTLLQSVNLGTKPTGEEMVSAGESCPICHDDYTTPVRLDCGHIFCELCISAWLDREHTCPLCRAKVADEPLWRDGSTTLDFQLY